MGNEDSEGSFEKYGVYVGIIGARFERTDLMESQHMLITKVNNNPQKGYGKNKR